MRNRLSGIYVLTDDFFTPHEILIEKVEELLKSGVKLIQLRDKIHTDKELLPKALAIQALCKEFNATFFINDRVNLAKQVKSDGLHIGIEDENLEKARKILPKTIIGVSCYGDLKRAQEAEKKGADYVAFGSFFPSSTKPKSPTVPLETILKAKELLKIPICAIGGIDKTNIHLLKDADMISVVSAAYKPLSIKENIEFLKKVLK